ncbi:MAG: hypothetical protein DI586_03260 [Micavibrio aeruginosavorus]|uniref:YbaK/aminoacyl-tRNA synthetase-associated domain-containing protein n=1 Tax=Micavibrio aeruginosavorus TaxID=349221 RepID=A0A2W5FNN1_9BACT|nr:MAG: hypothetical protein DI586_03260 [Micavibrio aeruginosavorus]
MSLSSLSGEKPVGKSVEDEAAMTAEKLLSCLKALGIGFTLYKHRAVFSVGEAKDVDEAIPGAHTRNLFVRDKKERMFLITLMAHTKIDMKKLAELLGVGRLSFGSPERLVKYLGVTPGSVTPFSIVNDRGHQVTLVLDKEMMDNDIVNYHPLVNTMTVGLTPSDLLKFLENCGCVPQIMDLQAASGE